jgi:hypothetical protein
MLYTVVQPQPSNPHTVVMTSMRMHRPLLKMTFGMDEHPEIDVPFLLVCTFGLLLTQYTSFGGPADDDTVVAAAKKKNDDIDRLVQRTPKKMTGAWSGPFTPFFSWYCDVP